MRLLDRLEQYASDRENEFAYINSVNENDRITYGELKKKSDRLACHISTLNIARGLPIVVYGHKQNEMIIAFLACVKSGHPYCPVDISMPESRLSDILEMSQSKLLIAVEKTNVTAENVINLDEMQEIISCSDAPVCDKTCYVSGDETYYIIFTSGSTGKPKGVQISADCLDNFLNWIVTVGRKEQYDHKNIFLNQAPFSFDLSVMDVYTSLYTGGTIWALDKRVQANFEALYSSLSSSRVSVWVSTPSFMNMCLMNKRFNQEMMPDLRLILFCGEVLPKQTAGELLKRFPMAKVVNTYGPTESTVAVTQIEITADMLGEESLSIGVPRGGSPIYIMKDGNTVPDGERGELVITGDTLAKGYLNQPELTNEKFVSYRINGKATRCYLTGDEGYYDENGRLYYSGRIDFQLKLHGYRIELGDIENNIMQNDNVRHCVVLPIVKNGVNKALAAVIVPSAPVNDEFEFSQSVRKELMKKLPEYMVPQKFIFLDKMPMTNNGKADRNVLKKML